MAGDQLFQQGLIGDHIAVGTGDRSQYPVEAFEYRLLQRIFSGQAKGTTGLFNVLVGEFLGAERQPVTYVNDGKLRHITVGRKIQGTVFPVEGKNKDEDVVIRNTEYWMGPDITVATASKGRVRAFGRVWDFEGRSAEICQIDWHGPK